MSCERQEKIAVSSAVKTEAEFLRRLALVVSWMEYAYPVLFPDLDPSV